MPRNTLSALDNQKHSIKQQSSIQWTQLLLSQTNGCDTKSLISFLTCMPYTSGRGSLSHTSMCWHHPCRLLSNKSAIEHINTPLCMHCTTIVQVSQWDSTALYIVSPCTTLQMFKSLTPWSHFILNGSRPHFIVISTTFASHDDTLSTLQQQHASYQRVLINLVVQSLLLWLHGK